MKQRLQGMLMGMVVAMLLLGTVTVLGATTRTIEVTFGNVRTTLFGQELVARDEQGLVIEPFSYNGRAYFPVEIILQAMGTNAQWNEALNTLNFGMEEQPIVTRERTPLHVAAMHFEAGGSVGRPTVSVRDVEMGGTTFRNALSYSGNNNNFREDNIFSLHNLNAQYQILSGHVGRVDNSSLVDATVVFFGDGVRLATYEIRAGELPSEFSVSVEGVQLLRVEFVIAARVWTDVNYALIAYLQ